MINVGINGFGRIGKLAARMMMHHPLFKVVSVNHPTLTRDDFIKLLKYDSVHRRYSMNDRFVNMVNIHNNKRSREYTLGRRHRHGARHDRSLQRKR